MTDYAAEEIRVAKALLNVKARLPADTNDVELPILSSDPDFDDLPRNHTEGTIDDQITQEAVIRLARAAIVAIKGGS